MVSGSSQSGRAGGPSFRRYGKWTLPLAWLPVIGDAFTVVAGAARVRLGLFVLLVALGKAARYAVVIMGGLWAMT